MYCTRPVYCTDIMQGETGGSILKIGTFSLLGNENKTTEEALDEKEKEIRKLKIEMAEVQNERNVLSTELERTRQELKGQLSVVQPEQSDSTKENNMEFLYKERTRLIEENETLIKEKKLFEDVIKKEEKESIEDKTKRVVTSLLSKEESLKEEIEVLKGRLNESDKAHGITFVKKNMVNNTTSPLRDHHHHEEGSGKEKSLMEENEV